jgi:hypothetical protein
MGAKISWPVKLHEKEREKQKSSNENECNVKEQMEKNGKYKG